MASSNLTAQRDKIQRLIEALEQSLKTEDVDNSIDILSSDSDQSNDEGSEDDDEELPLGMGNLAAKREKIERQIKELELTLGQDTSSVDIEILTQGDGNDIGRDVESSGEDSEEEFSLPPNAETCLQINLVYQDILGEKLTELERLLVENQEQQKEVMVQVSGPVAPQATSPGIPPLKVFLGNFMKPYFKDKLTGLGPPANPETRDKMNKGTISYEGLKIKRWEGWQKTLLFNSVVSDTMKRMLQPKLSKVEYLNGKMAKAEGMEKQILQKQINQIEREIEDISSMSEDQLVGNRHDDHDWEKISNIDFEGTRSAEDISRFWENYLHPSINKSSWKEDEIEQLSDIVEKKNCCHWDQIADELGTNRTAFTCLQTHQRYIHKGFKKRSWTKEEDQVLKELVDKMRIGNFIPYTQISYFIEGREAAQLVYRWTQNVDPNLKKGPWTKEEDEMLLKAVEKYGVRDWWKIRDEVPGRNDGQCRDRYLDCLCLDVKKGRWSPEEEAMLIRLVQKYGVGRWSKIASEIPNRIDSQCLQKWRSITGTTKKRRTPRKRKRTSKGNRKRKILRVKKEEESDSPEEGEVIYMSSEEEEKEEETAKESAEPDLEVEKREKYILPSMKEWIPKMTGLLPHVGQSVWNNPTNQKLSLGKATQGHNACSVNGLPSPFFPTGVRSTLLDQFGCPMDNDMGIDSPMQSALEHCEKDIIKVSVREVRNLLRSNGGGSSIKQRRIMTRRRLKMRKTSHTNSKKNGVVQNQGVAMRCKGQGSFRRPTLNTGGCVVSDDSNTYCSTLNNDLLLAVTPWVGHLLIALTSSKNERCEEDMVREKTKRIGLTSTPVFSLFLKILSIDAEGCKKLIEARKKTVFSISSEAPPKVNPPPSPSHGHTVAQMLYEKRRQVYKKKKEDHKMEAQKKSGLIMPYVMIPQAMVITQSLLQGIQPLAAPSSTADKPTVAKGMETGEAQSRKRTKKPTEKARALIADSKTKVSPKSKKACLQNVSLQDGNNEIISQVPLTPSTPITWILTPNGLLPLSGLVPTQAIPVGMNPIQNPIAVKPNSSLTFSFTPARGVESPSNVVFVSPSQSISAIPPTSFMGESSVLKRDSSISTSTSTPVGTAVLPNSTKLIHSVTSQRPVSVPHSNSACAQVPPCFLATSPVHAILPVPAPRNTGSSGAVAPCAISQRVTPLSPIRPYPQGLPILQVCHPPTPRVIGNTSVNPVTSLQPLVSPSQQRVVRILKSNQSSLRLGPNPAAPIHRRSERALSFDPSLIFMENVSQVKKWMNGGGGVTLPQSDISLPYLPPFVSSLTTFTNLLKCKSSLESCALPLVSSNEESSREEAPEKAIRHLVAERFGSNPAYLLLKARFLSCFTLPAFLATVDPFKNVNSENKCVSSEDSEEEDEKAPEKHGDPVVDVGRPKDGLLRTDGQGAVAAEFSGMVTRYRSKRLKNQ